MTPSATLTVDAPALNFNSTPGSNKFVSTSGVTDGATLKLQHKVTELDEWVDNPNTTPAADTHIAGVLTVVAVFNRVLADGAGPATVVHVNI